MVCTLPVWRIYVHYFHVVMKKRNGVPEEVRDAVLEGGGLEDAREEAEDVQRHGHLSVRSPVV